MTDSVILAHRGEKFARGDRDGLFLKDVMHDGTWIHPVTNRVIEVTPEIRQSVQSNMAKFLANGNRVPMPDGHVIDTAANRGFWPGPFAAVGADVLAVAEPKDADTRKQMVDGSADAVSVCWYPKYRDSMAVEYENVFEHICLTNYPVITRQRKFIALSGKPADASAPFIDRDVLARIAAPEEDEELLLALEKLYGIVKGEEAKAIEEIEAIMLTPAEKIAAMLAYGEAEALGAINSNGTFKGGFDGCMRVQQGKGRSAESARRLCAYIGRRAGKIK